MFERRGRLLVTAQLVEHGARPVVRALVVRAQLSGPAEGALGLLVPARPVVDRAEAAEGARVVAEFERPLEGVASLPESLHPEQRVAEVDVGALVARREARGLAEGGHRLAVPAGL